MKNIAVIVAAGDSRRFESKIIPKQYIKINDKTILGWVIDIFLQNEFIDNILVIINKNHQHFYQDSIKGFKILDPIIGGKTRQESVFLGLKNLEKLNPKNVLIHDAVRPLVTKDLINNVIKELEHYDAVDIGLPITDTVKFRGDDVVRTFDRNQLYATQTPQGFKFTTILRLHKETQENFTDDISLCLKNNIKINKINGDKNNIKITNYNDLNYFKFMTTKNKVYRTGLGLDVHKFSQPLSEDTIIKICGIGVTHNQSIIAYSDGDVGFHAITESMLGAMALDNIGQLFPSNNDRYKDIDSSYFLNYTLNELCIRDGKIINIDVTIICEKPKIMPHSKKMRQNIANVLQVGINQVSVKAITIEGMGFLGAQNGIAAQAICTIIL